MQAGTLALQSKALRFFKLDHHQASGSLALVNTAPYDRNHNAANEIPRLGSAGRANLSHRLNVPYLSRVLCAAREPRRAADDFEGPGYTSRLHLHQHAAQADSGRAAKIHRGSFRIERKDFSARSIHRLQGESRTNA